MRLTKYYPSHIIVHMREDWKECSHEGCDKPVAVMVAQLCINHYHQKIRRDKEGTCSLPWCERQLYAKGLCNSHYNAKREGRELIDPNAPKPECAFDGCDRPVLGYQELCATHYNQKWRGVSLSPIRERRLDPNRPGERNCKKCGVWKSEEDFYNGSRPGQKQSKCRECYIEDTRARRLALSAR